MSRKCVDSEQTSLRKSRRFCSVGSVAALMLSRAAHPITAFGGWRRSLQTLNGMTVPKSDYFRVAPSHTLQSTSFRSHLFSTNPSDASHVSQQRRDSSKPPEMHIVLDSLQKSFERLILSNLPNSCDNVVLLVGLSGGCDSMGLLHALERIMIRAGDHTFYLPGKPDTLFPLHVVHFNHKQRGDASDGDEQFVKELCESLKLPCHLYEWDSNNSTNFSQDTARQWRRNNMYSLLQSLAPSDECKGVILTAHHLDDSEESMLLKMLRGVHLTNLAGMDPIVLGSKDMPNAIIARPLLDVRKADIVDFLESNHLSWREDESNASDKYLRNRVRNELIPLLSDMVGGANVLKKRLENLSHQSRELNEDISLRAQEYLNVMNDNEVFLLTSGSLGLVEKEAFHQWAETRIGIPLMYDQLQRICTQLAEHPHQQQWTLQVGRGWNIIRNGVTLSAVRGGQMEEETKVEREIEWSFVQNEDEQEDMECSLVIQIPATFCPVDNDCSFVVSEASRTGKWNFIPPWRENPIELRDFLRGQRVPLHRRGCSPVIYMKHHHKSSLVAVFVEQRHGEKKLDGKWVVDADFSARTDEGLGQRVRLHIQL